MSTYNAIILFYVIPMALIWVAVSWGVTREDYFPYTDRSWFLFVGIVSWIPLLNIILLVVMFIVFCTAWLIEQLEK